MRTHNIPINNLNHALLFEESDGTPVSCLTTPWLDSDRGFFRVYLAVVGPKSEEPEDYLPLSRMQAESMLQTLADMVETLKQELRR